MSVNINDVKKWHEAGLTILPSKEKLDSKINKTTYSQDFLTIYYGISQQTVNNAQINASLVQLKKCATNLTSSNPMKIVLREFVASSTIVYKPENIQSFRQLLKVNSWLPVDPEVERRKAEAAAEQVRREREERERLKRAAEARARKEREERERQEREERWRRERETRMRRMRKVRIGIGIAMIVLLGYGLIAGIPAYRYHHSEYKELRVNAETFVAENRYTDAITALREAQRRKSSKKKIQEIEQRIDEVKALRENKITQLKNEITTLLASFNTSFKYGRPENDFKTTQQKIDLLKSIDNADHAQYQKQLDYHKNRK